MNVIEKLETVFRREFEDETILLTTETTADDISEWDSLSHVNLILAIEEAFDLHFNVTEIATLENVGQLADIIQQKSTSI